MTVALLAVIGKAALPVLTGGASSVLDIGSAILQIVWEQWSKAKKEAERRKELETLAAMTAEQVRNAVRDVLAELLKTQTVSDDTRRRLEGYLLAVPAQVRRTFRRSDEPTGRTIPANLALRRVEDLAMFLPPRPPRFIAGQQVPHTDYTLIELLGLGGFGEVWRARKPHFPDAALKFCHDELAADDLRRSVKLLSQLQAVGRHPNIIELRDTFLSAKPPFLVYELVEGGDLGGLILDWHREQGGPTPAEAARMMARLCEIVAFAHQNGIVHRDLKPANILIAPDRSFKIADFGIGGVTAEAAARANQASPVGFRASAADRWRTGLCRTASGGAMVADDRNRVYHGGYGTHRDLCERISSAKRI